MDICHCLSHTTIQPNPGLTLDCTVAFSPLQVITGRGRSPLYYGKLRRQFFLLYAPGTTCTS